MNMTRRDYYNNLITENGSDQERLFRTTKSLLGLSKMYRFTDSGADPGGGLRVAPPFGKFRACLTAPVYHFLITEIIAYCCFIFATPSPPHLKKSWIRPCVLSFQPNAGDDFGDISDIKRDLDCESSAAISAFAIHAGCSSH